MSLNKLLKIGYLTLNYTRCAISWFDFKTERTVRSKISIPLETTGRDFIFTGGVWKVTFYNLKLYAGWFTVHWGDTYTHLRGRDSDIYIQGLIINLDRYLYLSSGIINLLERYLNPCSAIRLFVSEGFGIFRMFHKSRRSLLQFV